MTMNITQAQYEVNAVAIFCYFIGKGVPQAPAVGILTQGNQESSLDPTAVGDNKTAFGLWQDHADRCEAMLKGCGIDPRVDEKLLDLCEAAWWELNGPERKAFKAILATSTPYDAGAAGCLWERPAADERNKRGLEAIDLALFLQARGLWYGAVPPAPLPPIQPAAAGASGNQT